ncbi:MAG: hypothetical protein ACKV19_11640 [Verrucomicrobiales bacterium]
MAQWARQYSGLSHESKVADCEAILREAVERCRESQDSDGWPDFAALAGRVLRARRKAWGAALSRLEEPRTGAVPQERIDRLRGRIAELEAGGVAGILREFAVAAEARDSMPPSD